MTLSTVRAGPSEGRRASRTIGAAVGVAIAVVANVIALVLDDANPIGLFQFPFLVLGIPAAGLVGAWQGPTIRERSGIRWAAFLMAVAIIPIADTIVVLLALAGAFVGTATTLDPVSLVIGPLALWLIGLVVVGLPMLVVTAPCAIVWALIVRALVVRRGSKAVA